MSEKNKKSILLTSLGVIILVVALFSVSYAFFSYVYTSDANNISTGQISFDASIETFSLVNQFPTDSSNASTLGSVSISGYTTYENGIEFTIKAIELNNNGEQYGIYPTINLTTEEVEGVTYTYVYDEERDGLLQDEDILLSGKVAGNVEVPTETKLLTISAFYDRAKYHITKNTLQELVAAGLKPDYVTSETMLVDPEIWNSLSSNPLARSVTPVYSFRIQVISTELGRLERVGVDGQFKYIDLGDNKIQITKYIGDDTDVVIPATYDGYDVYSVGNKDATIDKEYRYNIFGEANSTTNSTVKSITISEGIERIEVAAFHKCTGLTNELVLPSSLTYIGDLAFCASTGLNGPLSIPEGVTYIGTAAFQQCSGFNGELSLPDTLTKISDYAFYGNTGLTGDLVIPGSVETIGNHAFYGCTKIDGDLVISEGVKSIGTSTFSNCSKIKSLTLPTGLETIGKSAFRQCTGMKGDLTIPEGVTTIGEQAFYKCGGFDGVLSLPNTLVEIGAYAFSDCSGLHGDLTIPNGVVKIGKTAFQYCDNLDGVLSLPNTLVEIGDTVFNHTTKLTNVKLTIPSSLKVIGHEDNSTHVFYDFATKTLKEYDVEVGNTAFKDVDGVLFDINVTRLIAYPPNRDDVTYVIPEGVISLDEMAFSRAGSSKATVTEQSLKKVVLPNSFVLSTTLPSTFLNTGNNLAVALYTLTGVTEIGVKDDNPNYKTEDGILYSKDGTTLWYVPFAKTDEITILDGVTTIKDGAFFDGTRSQKVTIPASVTEIESETIADLQRMKSSNVTFAEGSIFEFNSSGKIVKKSN